MSKLIIANWKCNPTSLKQAKQLFSALKRGLSSKRQAEVVVCPPLVFLPLLKSKNIKLGSQNVFYEEQGPYTGEVSALMLKDLGVKYVLVGHSERRKLFNETNETINNKVKALLRVNLTPVLCVGETLAQRTEGEAFNTIRKQLRECLKGVKKGTMSNLVIAYEPVWAIGTGKPCLVDGAETVSLFIRKTLKRLAGKKASQSIRVLYGGSVNAENCQSYLESEWLNGLLVGSASLKSKEFLQIIEKAV